MEVVVVGVGGGGSVSSPILVVPREMTEVKSPRTKIAEAIKNLANPGLSFIYFRLFLSKNSVASGRQ